MKSALTGLAAFGAAIVISAFTTPAGAIGPLGPSAASKIDNSVVEKVHRRRWHRRHAYYPRYRYRYRPYYYSYYGQPYYYGTPYYRPYDQQFYGAYGPRFYGYGVYGPRFGVRIGF